jgi:RNA polymerase sigma-70 factor (ECF subfamily)
MIPVAAMLAREPHVSVVPLAAAQGARLPAMDEARFRLLYQDTARPLRAYLRRACGDITLADDLLQEAYFRLLRSGFDREDGLEVRKYLFRIATNLLRDHHRGHRPETDDLPDLAAGDREHDAVELRSDVGRVFSEMTPRDRQILWLAYVEGASHREIAEAVGLKASSLRSMLFRARQRMAELLRDRGLGPEERGPS